MKQEPMIAINNIELSSYGHILAEWRNIINFAPDNKSEMAHDKFNIGQHTFLVDGPFSCDTKSDSDLKFINKQRAIIV